jgi:hypothetical protein
MRFMKIWAIHLSKWHIINWGLMLAIFTALTFCATYLSLSAENARGNVFMATAGTITSPMTGALARACNPAAPGFRWV